MNNLKFKAWDILNKKMLDYGDIMTLPMWEVFPGTPEQRPFEIMQYTGRKDCNGTEIYKDYIIKVSEGDFSKHWIGVVKWGTFSCEFTNYTDYSDELFGVDTWLVNGYPLSELILEGCKVEVIGNIYENPDLLEDN